MKQISFAAAFCLGWVVSEGRMWGSMRGVLSLASQVALVAKNLPANAGDIRDTALIPGSGRSLREEHGNPPQYSYLENTVDRGAWQAAVHGVTKGQTRLSDLTRTHCLILHWSNLYIARV